MKKIKRIALLVVAVLVLLVAASGVKTVLDMKNSADNEVQEGTKWTYIYNKYRRNFCRFRTESIYYLGILFPCKGFFTDEDRL